MSFSTREFVYRLLNFISFALFLCYLQEIEKTLEKVKSQSYSTLISVGAQGMNLALQGAIAVSDMNKKDADSFMIHSPCIFMCQACVTALTLIC